MAGPLCIPLTNDSGHNEFSDSSYQFVVGEPFGVVVEVPLERLALQPVAQGHPLRDVAIVAQSLRLRFVVLPQPEVKDETNL